MVPANAEASAPPPFVPGDDGDLHLIQPDDAPAARRRAGRLSLWALLGPAGKLAFLNRASKPVRER